VSVGDHSLNVYEYGNKQGKHTLVCISGQGVHDYSVTMSKVTDQLADDNRIVYVDRAGYGLSDDTKIPQTNENIVKDKVIKAHKITLEKASNKASALRFKKILDWIKEH
jgi:pimeloyl-ACP methyl ester carboxylesterase